MVMHTSNDRRQANLDWRFQQSLFAHSKSMTHRRRSAGEYGPAALPIVK
jgi:hypothetical protein